MNRYGTLYLVIGFTGVKSRELQQMFMPCHYRRFHVHCYIIIHMLRKMNYGNTYLVDIKTYAIKAFQIKIKHLPSLNCQRI